MDYDDNDFQSQNLRLAGEASNKLSPVLQPYALPRYDFDESLHGHIRFDSSVDTEVFLGIESNEDNQWIEDFSHSSGGIVFSSSAAGTCSILRQNNVWSEVASSESVEMLLKSVGQDEIIPGQNLTKGADACDELGRIMKRMEPDLKHEESSPSQIGGVMHLQPTLHPDEISGKISELKDDMGGQQPSVEGASQNKEGDSSDEKGMDEGSALIRGSGIPITDRNESADGKCNVSDSTNDSLEVNGSLNNRRQECSTTNMYDTKDAPILKNDTADANVNHLEEKNIVGDTEYNVREEVPSEGCSLAKNSGSRVSSHEENPLTLETGLIVDDNLMRTCTVNSAKLSPTVVKEDSETRFFSGTSDHSGNCENVVLSQHSDISGWSKANVHDASALPSEVETVLKVYESGDTESNIVGSAKHEAKMDLIVKNTSDAIVNIENKDLLETDCQLDMGCNKGVDPSICGSSTGDVSQFQSAIGDGKESDASNMESENEQQTSILGGFTLEHGKETSEILYDSSVRENDSGETKATSKKDEKVNVEEDNGRASLLVADVEPIQKNEETSSNQTPLSLKPPCLSDSLNGEGIYETTLVSEDKDGERISVPSVDGSGDLRHNGSISSVPTIGSQAKLGAAEDGTTSVNPDNVSCGSYVIRSSQCSQSETRNEGAIISTAQRIQASEVVDRQPNGSSVSRDTKGNGASEADRSFTFEVPPLADMSQKDGKWQPFSTMQHDKLSSKIMEMPPSTSSISQVEVKPGQDATHITLKASGRQTVRSSSKSSEHKTRRASGKSTTKETPKKGKPVKEASSARHSERGDTTSHLPLNSAGILQSNEMQQYGQVECNNMKAFGVLSTSISTLPDLNTSVSSSAAFQQPFTDLQQVQLRAQIFVYGALIQGTAPDEAYMISAFGGPDGGKSTWESAWRACLERAHGQKSHLNTPETHLQSGLGNKASDLSIKQSGHQSKGTSSPASRTTSKVTPTTVVNPVIPLSSPLWSLPTPSGDVLQHAGVPRSAVLDYQQALSPLHPHQIPPIRNFIGHNASWVSQSHYPGPWVKQTSTVDTSARFSVLPFTETVNLTPVRESSGLPSSGVLHSRSVNVPVGPVGSNANPSKILTGSSLIDMSKVSATPDKHYAESKPRKRKKIPVSEEVGWTLLHSQSQSETFSAPIVTSNVSASVAIVTSSVPLIMSANHSKQEEQGDQRVTLSVDTFNKLKEAQKQAEDASEIAAAAVSDGQEIWNQLEKQKNCRLPLNVETKLSSATVAIAAAAAVAKAAAAAANVASNAALQAKLMAYEAFVSSGCSKSAQANLLDVRNLSEVTPASILKGCETTDTSQSIIIAAKEAARRRVEAASAAVKQAENMDAIVRAAELAAEAVSQAGKIVAMGEPLPLNELVGVGSGAHWRASLTPSDLVIQSKGMNTERGNRGGAAESLEAFAGHSEDSLDKTDHGFTAASRVDKKNKKGRRDSDISKSTEMVVESQNGMEPSSTISQTKFEKMAEVLKEDDIKEGSRVEVLRGGAKVAWFNADVLSLKDEKAYVCYHELQLGGHKLEEWVALKGEGDGIPRIRLARPITAMPFEGTRKRRRAAMGDHKWSVGDRVDAWMQDSWQEGVVADKSKNDESSFSIHFPASGESSVVQAWNLRSSLIWKNGSWTELSNLADNVHSSHKGDTPQEKRLRLIDPTVEAKEKDKVSRNNDILEAEKPDDTRLLDLTASEKIFSIGRSSRDDIKTDSLRMTRTGLQKEGSRVIFGVPKPGKKKKFMEVSKHYIADQSNRGDEADDSLKSANYLMPGGSEPRGVKNNSKREPRDKGVAVSKPKVLKSGKPPIVSSRMAPRKDNKSDIRISEPDDAARADVSKMKSSVSNSENEFEKNEVMETRSFQSSDGASEDQILFSSVAISSDAPPRKTSTWKTKTEHVHKGKLGPDSTLKTSTEVVEPRRSIRRIQPTSRLLEGLQSSLIISKIPSVSHDKSQKNQRSKRD